MQQVRAIIKTKRHHQPPYDIGHRPQTDQHDDLTLIEDIPPNDDFDHTSLRTINLRIGVYFRVRRSLGIYPN